MTELTLGWRGATWKLALRKRRPKNNIEWAVLRMQAGEQPVIIQVRRDVWLYFVRLGEDKFHVWLMNPQGKFLNTRRVMNGAALTRLIIKTKRREK